MFFFFLIDTVVTKPPYEVNESGWGEFEIQIKIFFMDQAERPVSTPSTCCGLEIINSVINRGFS